MRDLVESYLSHVNDATAILGILAFVTLGISRMAKGLATTRSKRNRRNPRGSFYSLVAVSFAAANIPMGTALLVCAFDTQLLARLEGLNFQITIAGLVVIGAGVIGCIEEWQR
jgi:hypothetical protein